ncbi:MAG: hypothetical protein IOD12_02230 [Silvanigrellales bacterium]|nr:hypothetical protein [Silvanigrellales bacterium]
MNDPVIRSDLFAKPETEGAVDVCEDVVLVVIDSAFWVPVWVPVSVPIPVTV